LYCDNLIGSFQNRSNNSL